MNTEMTHDAKTMLKFIYSLYMSRRKEGKGRVEANFFGNSQYIKETYFNEMPEEDVADICWELHRAGMLHCLEGDNKANYISLTTNAIIYCETSFGRNFKELTTWLTTIKGILPL